MLKRISVNQLTLGMHLKEFCGSYLDHPFWRTGFVLTQKKDLTAILTSSIKEVSGVDRRGTGARCKDLCPIQAGRDFHVSGSPDGQGGRHRWCRKLVEEISDSVARNPGALISLARLKTVDDYTYMHSVAVCAMMVGLAKQLGLDEVQTRSSWHGGFDA
jgi:HD-GYP domain-containing protein (c-di-GMP phosphodiesterase class II)